MVLTVPHVTQSEKVVSVADTVLEGSDQHTCLFNLIGPFVARLQTL